MQNAAPTELPTTTTTKTPPAKPQLAQKNNNNESSPDVQSVEITKDPSVATVSNVSEVQSDPLSQERLKRSIDVPPNVASKTVENSENVSVAKSDEVKIEDLNEYDSKNFVENSETTEEDDEEGTEEETEEEDEGEDEYDDAENALGSEEEEIKKPVIEEPIVKKTAYVTTDSNGDNSDSIETDKVQPTLEIMAPTQTEIEQLKQQQDLKDSLQETNDTTQSAVDSSVSLNNGTVPSTTATNTESIASENQYTTTTVPIDSPQNPLDIPIETTTPLPDAAQTKLEVEKEEPVSTNNANGNSATIADPIPKIDPVTVDTPKSEVLVTPNSEEVVLNDEIPPFKPLPRSVENIVGDLNDSISDAPSSPPVVDQKIEAKEPDNIPVVDQKVETKEPDKADPLVIQEPVTPSNENGVTTNEGAMNALLNEENQIIKEDEPVTTKPTTEDVDSVEVNNESLPIVEAERTIDNSSEPASQDSELVAESVNNEGFDNDPSNFTSTISDSIVVTETPVEISSGTDHIPTTEFLTQNINEGVGVIEPIIQSVNIEEQQHVEHNAENEPIENVESTEGFFGGIINSVKNLFGGSSTVESLVDDQSNENFDKALNDILFSQAVPTSEEKHNEGECISFCY